MSDSKSLATRLSLAFPLLSDPGLKVALTYGVAMEGSEIAVPSVFVIRRDGTIAWRYIGEDVTDRPSAREVLQRAEQAR